MMSDSSKKPPRVGQPRAPVSRDVKARIADNLKRAFDDVANEPVPDDLLRLLDALAKKEKGES